MIAAGGAAASVLGFEVHLVVAKLAVEQSVMVGRFGQARYWTFLSGLSLLEAVLHLVVRLRMRL